MSILQIYAALHAANCRSKFHRILQGHMAENHIFCSRGQTIGLRSNLRPHLWKIITRQRFFVFFTFWFGEVFGQQSSKSAFEIWKSWVKKIFRPPLEPPRWKNLTKNVFYSNLHDKRWKVSQKYWRLPKKKKLLHAMKENLGLKDPPPPKVGLRCYYVIKYSSL